MWCPNQECPDAVELGAPAEFVEGKLECTFCGSALVSSPPAWAAPAEEIRLVPVLPILDASWLPRVKSILDAAGVRFLLDDGARRRSGYSGGGGGFDPVAGRPVIMVEEGDAARASELLGDLKAEIGPDQEPGGAPPELTAPAWQPSSCPQCRQALESGEGDEPLAYCYHCGASLSPEASDS